MARSVVSATPAFRLVPSGRSLAVGFGLLVAAMALYGGARETSVFAVRQINVQSVTPSQARVIRRALAGLEGASLLKVDQAEIQRRLDALPHVHLLSYDRAFPNRLELWVTVERPAAVLRRGSDRWLVSPEGRILRSVDRRLRRPLPVVWAQGTVEPEVGAILQEAEPAAAVRAIASVQAVAPSLARRLWYVTMVEGGTAVAVLDDRFEIRLGTPRELRLKVAVARRVLATLRREGSAAAYLDVSVPERPVTGESLESQVEPESVSAEFALTEQ